MNAKCTGCGIDSDKTEAYKDEPIDNDGTYHDGKFVCDKCYDRLVAIGLGLGKAEHVQARAAAILPPPPKTVEFAGEVVPVVSSYTLEQAILDGVLVAIGAVGPVPVVFNMECFKSRGYDKKENLADLDKTVRAGLEAIKKPDPEDGGTKLRVLEKDKLWIIFDGLAITFMRPGNY